MKALFIGRFQPFHNGHLEVIKFIINKCNFLVIGIGSSQYKNTKENPFSLEERKDMINNTLKEHNIKDYKLIEIPDIHNPPRWVEHVLNIYSDFDVVYTNNNFTKKLFEEKGFKVQATSIFNKKEYSGKIIREKIKKDLDWEKSVPDQVSDIINKIEGKKRLKNCI